MSADQNLALKEYEISKENIKWVMGQLVAVGGALSAISVVLFQLVFDGEPQPVEKTTALTIMIIILLNVVIAFWCYQLVQIIALHRHIQTLEARLKEAQIFRWESQIARIWFGGDSLTLIFNVLVALPAIGLVVTLYVSLGVATQGPNWFWILTAVNFLYAIALGLCVLNIARRIASEVPLIGSKHQ